MSAGSTPSIPELVEAVRDGLRCGRSDNQFLDGRDFDQEFWDGKDSALTELAERLEAAEKDVRTMKAVQAAAKNRAEAAERSVKELEQANWSPGDDTLVRRIRTLESENATLRDMLEAARTSMNRLDNTKAGKAFDERVADRDISG